MAPDADPLRTASASPLLGWRVRLAPRAAVEFREIAEFREVDWSDRDITPGADWDTEISARLSTSNIVLVLVSADFLASSYAYGRELRRALELND